MSKIQMRMRAISGDSQDDSQIKASSKILQEKAEDNQFSMITAVKDFNFQKSVDIEEDKEEEKEEEKEELK